MKQTFEHNGVKYTVRPLNAFEADMRGTLMLAAGEAIVKANGHEDGDLGHLSRIDDRLIGYFVDWCLTTSADKKLPADPTPEAATRQQVFADFKRMAFADTALMSKWKGARDAANMEQADPQPQSGDETDETR